MCKPSIDYEPRRPGACALYSIVRDHFERFLRRSASLRDGEGLPAFVEDEFRAFLKCGWLAGGFARFHCAGCGLDRLVAFSCKGRGFCPSCGGRRMTEHAAHLVDDVLPDVPVRQWVLSLPHRLRYQLAWRHDVCRAVVAIFMRATERALRASAEREGVVGGRGGGVAIVQRFGGALNLNIHVHALLLDGVFAQARDGSLRFHPSRLTDLDVAEVLAAVEARVGCLLERRGLAGRDDEDGDAWENTPVLGELAAASVQGTQALSEGRGRRVPRIGAIAAGGERLPPGPLHARVNGFDLHANLRVPAGQRDRLESVCRYTLRPPVAAEHVRVTDDGAVLLQLRHRWADGTTHLRFDPVEFLGRLAVLVPRPRINLLFYYGVLGARAAWRTKVVPGGDVAVAADPIGVAKEPATGRSGRGYRWAELMRRTFGFDVLACPRCGRRLRLVALIEQAVVIARILGHLGLPTRVPAAGAARSPPIRRAPSPRDTEFDFE